jgi:ABC-type nickel/cobalt efflux system permease component RcnA
MAASLTGMLLGILLGVRHGLEPDHLAAISVLSSEKPDARRGALLGAWWGLGHTAALLAVGLVLAALRAEMPPRLSDFFELAVAGMLIVLGVRAIARALREGGVGPVSLHDHEGTRHMHAGAAAHVHVGPWTLAKRPLAVGILHGLAGSGALTALVVADLPSTVTRVLFIALFGAGSIVGMATLSGIAGWPLARIGRRPVAARIVAAMTGAVSTGLGVLWGWPLVGRLLA